jgi:hypothetical protein
MRKCINNDDIDCCECMSCQEGDIDFEMHIRMLVDPDLSKDYTPEQVRLLYKASYEIGEIELPF